MASEEILCEYFNFLRNLPSEFIECEKKKLIDTVRKEWKIDDILSNVHGLNFEKTLVDSKNTSSLTDELSIKLGRSLRVLCPPVSKCILCDKKLTVNNQPVQIVVHTLMGPKMYSKYILRCKNCRLTTKEKYKKDDLKLRQDMYYHPDKVSKSSSWRKYYTFSCIDHSSLYFVT